MWRRWLVGALLVALLAPMLAGMLPRPALSAEEGLQRALAQSLCSTPGERDRDGGQDHDGQCQLCVLGCAACCVAAVADLPRQHVDLPRGSPRSIFLLWTDPATPGPLTRPLQPRAPPASLA